MVIVRYGKARGSHSFEGRAVLCLQGRPVEGSSRPASNYRVGRMKTPSGHGNGGIRTPFDV